MTWRPFRVEASYGQTSCREIFLGGESVALILIHLPIISVAVSLLVSTHLRHPV